MLMRLKKNKILRNMCVETTFLKDQLIQPIFVSENLEFKKEIPGNPNNFVMNLNFPVILLDPLDNFAIYSAHG